jgi:hypothetical protein
MAEKEIAGFVNTNNTVHVRAALRGGLCFSATEDTRFLIFSAECGLLCFHDNLLEHPAPTSGIMMTDTDVVAAWI